MKFDVIIGNPPYQLQDAGDTTGASPIYQLFVDQAKKLDPKYISMIIPSRWFGGGKGLENFRKDMLNDGRIRKIVDYTNASDCFPGVDIAGGVCYFLWERGSAGECAVVNHIAGKSYVSQRKLNQFDTFIRYGTAADVLEKVRNKTRNYLAEIVSSLRPFGLRTYVRPEEQGDLLLFWSGGVGNYPSEKVTLGLEMVNKWKTITSIRSYDHGGLPDKDGYRRVLSRIEILPPGTICTETYIVIGAFSTEDEARLLYDYLKTKFVRFLISLMSFSQDIAKKSYALVPKVELSLNWTDEKLYEFYQLSNEEINFIESHIKEM